MMRAFAFTSFGGPEVAELLDLPEPSPAPGQLLVRMTAAGVNPADVKVRSGARQQAFPVRFPMAMGREAAGTVVAVGEDVDGVQPGDEVFGATAPGTGGLAELALLPAESTARRPDAVPAEQAACIPVSIGTAWDALDELDLPPGATLLVLGAGGGVGTATCGLAVALGLRVIGVASASKREIVAGLGAEHVLSGEGWVDRVRTRVGADRGATAVDGLVDGVVDGLVDAVGGDALRAGVALVREPAWVRSVAAPQLAAELGGSGVTRRRTTAVFSAIAAVIASGAFTPLVSATVPLDRADRAVAVVETGHAAGNVVVTAA